MSCKDLEAVMVEIAGKNGGFMREGGYCWAGREVRESRGEASGL